MSVDLECCDPARYDRGECCGELVMPPPSVDWAVEGPWLLDALKQIEGGFVPDGGSMVLMGNWRGFTNGLQAIARTAIARATPGGGTWT